MACLAASQAATELSLTLARLEAPGFAAGPVSVRLVDGAAPSLQIAVDGISVQGHTFRSVRATCSEFSWAGGRIECRRGNVDLGTKVPFSFTYAPAHESLELVLRPGPKEAWLLRARMGGREALLQLRIENGALARLAPWLPKGSPALTGGVLNGVIALEGQERDRVRADLAVRDAAFSDASGTHAAEKLEATLRATAQRKGAAWEYSAALDWKAGELFWQPLYLQGEGQSVSVSGVLDEKNVTVAQAHARLGAAGELRASASWDRQEARLVSADLESGRLDASSLYSQILKPFFFGTALGELRAGGEARLTARWRAGALEAIDVTLRGLSASGSSAA